MNYDNLSKEELIALLKKNHTHEFEYVIDADERKLFKTCPCGETEVLDIGLLEVPSHSHKFKWSHFTTAFKNLDSEPVKVKMAMCETCGEVRIYQDKSVDVVPDVANSSKFENKGKAKTQMYYPKEKMNIVAFYGPIKSSYNNELCMYIKSDDGKWYKATGEISKFISDHYSEWDDNTEILFSVENKHVV